MTGDWKQRLARLVESLGHRSATFAGYLAANVESVAQVIRGLGPEDQDPRAGAGARVVFNMSCRHVPSFCADSAAGATRPYKNAYDMGRPSDDRKRVDAAVAKATALDATSICYGALETSGTGIRFYGDFCLVLKAPAAAADGTTEWDGLVVLDRNSYDVIREPARTSVEDRVSRGQSLEDAAAEELRGWMGHWRADLDGIVAIKVLESLRAAGRRWTTGQIAGAVLDDEDYVEILYPTSFGRGDVHEARLSASDAAAEADIADREAGGEAPAMHELEWRQQRREAKRALARTGVPVRIVTTPGRVKGG